jgi:hypothetical protein
MTLYENRCNRSLAGIGRCPGTGPLAGQGRDGPFRTHDHEPAARLWPCSYAGKIIRWLNELLPDGQALPETPVLTADGVKVPDVTWISARYSRELEARKPLVLERAPEICVEVLSPTNSSAEMNEKRALYFEAGAHEVWICGLDGKMEFYTPDLSRLCPLFPGQL